MNKLAIIITSIVALSACDGSSSSSEEASSKTYTRVTTDQPDPTQYENTIHIVYAVPSGNEDKERDKSYQLQQSIIAANKWFHEVSGKQLRLDLQDNGDVDITYWAMAETNAELHQSRWETHDTIEGKLKQTDWYTPDKLYVVYIEGSHFQTCDDELTNGGHMVNFYLHNPNSDLAYQQVFEHVCALEQFSTNEDVHGFNEYLFVHKVFLALGVDEFSSEVNDLMSYPQYGVDYELWTPEFVDFNNDDYFMHSDTNKVDILYSAFLLPNDGSELPPNWRDND